MAWRKLFRDRLRALLHSDAVHGEIDEEVRFHIEMRTEENVRRGMGPEEARRDAERRFGRPTRIKEMIELNPNVPVTRQTPPTFLLHAEDDPVDGVNNSLVYFAALKRAGVPAEMHVFVKGGHAFGLRPTESPITRWPQFVEEWLTIIGMLSR